MTPFEQAQEALVRGDVGALKSLLDAFPGLARARSEQSEGFTLLHRLPDSHCNSIEVARALIESGAEVDAFAQVFGGRNTPLSFVSSSRKLRLSDPGLQSDVIDVLLKEGAAINGYPGGWKPLSWAVAAGFHQAAKTLLDRGAVIPDLPTAAGLGRIDVVKQLFPNADRAERERALFFAGENAEVLDYLLANGVDIAARDQQGQTPLHLAAGFGRLTSADLLIRRGAPLEAKNDYNGTVLGQTIWFAVNEPFDDADYPAIVRRLLEAGANPDDPPELRAYVEELIR